jgi:hypothetical protein
MRALERTTAPSSPKPGLAVEAIKTSTPVPASVSLPGARAKEMFAPSDDDSLEADEQDETEETENGAANGANGEPVKRFKRRKRHRRRRQDPRKLSARTIFWVIFATLIALTFIWLVVRGPGPVLPKVESPTQDLSGSGI